MRCWSSGFMARNASHVIWSTCVLVDSARAGAAATRLPSTKPAAADTIIARLDNDSLLRVMLVSAGAVCPHTAPLHRCGFGRSGSCRVVLRPVLAPPCLPPGRQTSLAPHCAREPPPDCPLNLARQDVCWTGLR